MQRSLLKLFGLPPVLLLDSLKIFRGVDFVNLFRGRSRFLFHVLLKRCQSGSLVRPEAMNAFDIDLYEPAD